MAKLNVENTKQWFTQDEAARYIFEGDDICASVLNEFLENNRLIRYIKLNYDYPIDLIFKPNDAPCFTAFHKINETSLNEAKIPVSSSLSLSSGEVVEVAPPKIFFLERYLPRGEYELKSDPAKNEIVVLTTDITVRYWLDNSGVYGWLDVPNLFKDKRNEVFNQYEQGGVSDALIYANGLEAYYQPTAEPKDITIDKSRLNEVRDFNKTEKGALFNINPRLVNPDNSFEVGYPRHELERFIKSQREPTPASSPDTENQSPWKIKAQKRADELSLANPKWTKKKVANTIETEFKEQNTLNDLGKKSPDSQTIYKNIKINTARRK